MKSICFITNVDWFFHSHRRPLAKKLSSSYKTLVIAGDSGFKVNYSLETFQVKSRVPTVKGIFQLYNHIKKLSRDTPLIIVSPVMIILCHFLLRKRGRVFYNFSGLGFLRSKSPIVKNLIMFLIKVYPVAGDRVFVVQNSDDYKYLNHVFKLKKSFRLEIIPGSGYEEGEKTLFESNSDELTIGYVGRIRKDKGVLDLIKAVVQLRKNGFKVNLKIWGSLDDQLAR